MPATLRHFAINADDVQRAKAFYEAVFGWSFTPWGPPNFYQIKNAGTGFVGALQERPAPPEAAGAPGFVLTFEVDDLSATLAAIDAHGGRVVRKPFLIEGVGEIGYFKDSENNLCGLAQYLPGHWT